MATCLAAAVLLLRISGSLACTAIGVGRDASATGYPMIGHTDDSGPTTNDVRWSRVPAKTWPAGSLRPFYVINLYMPRLVDAERSPEYAARDGEAVSTPIGYIPQVSHTYGYWDTAYGVQNEVGLSIGESTCTARTAGWSADKPYGYNHAGIEDLTRLALERCATARCAVQLMGDIAVQHGFYSADAGLPEAPAYGGSSECLVLADATPGDVWIYNVLTGKNNASAIWAAQRVPSDHVVAIGNSFSIRKMNLTDSDNFLYSPGIANLAIEKGWWNPLVEAPNSFDFMRSYGYSSMADPSVELAQGIHMDSVLQYYSARRMWRVYSLLSPEEGAKLDKHKGNLPSTIDPYPASVAAPRASVTMDMVAMLFRDHYEGTEFDLTQGMAAGPYGNPNRAHTPANVMGQWERAISMFRTTYSFILQARPGGRSIAWFGYDAPHGTAYLPFYAAATQGAPSSYSGLHSGPHDQKTFSTDVAYWAFNLVNQYTDINFAAINKDVRARSKAVEDEARRSVAAWEREADMVRVQAGDTAALDLLTSRSHAFADKQVAGWWAFAWSLVVKYRGYVVTHNETVTGIDVAGQQYPVWWLESPEVGFTSWKYAGPFHGVLMSALPGALSAQIATTEGSSTTLLLAALLFVFPISMGLVGLAAFRVGLQKGHRDVSIENHYIQQV